jgi:hypothetical protein
MGKPGKITKAKPRRKPKSGINKRGEKLAMDPAVSIESRTIRNLKSKGAKIKKD